MRFALIICLVFFAFGAAFAQESAPPTVSLQLSDADIVDAFKTLSQQANVSIMGDSTVSGKVTCSLSGLTVDQALDVICKMNKLEWYKTRAEAADQLGADKLLKLIDALKQVGATSLVCEDPRTKTKIVYLPNAGSVDMSAIQGGLKLKEVYVVRAIPEQKADPAKPEDKTKIKADTGNKGKPSKGDLKDPSLSDPKAATKEAWDYVKQLPLDQQYQVVKQLRNDFYKSLSPQQKKDLQNYERQQAKQSKHKPRKK